MTRAQVCFIAFLLLCLLSKAWAGENRLYVANQFDFGAKRGFYVSLENSGVDGMPIRLAGIRLALGIADGRQWRFAIATPKVEVGQTLHIMAMVGGGKGTLLLNDQVVGQISGELSPADLPLSAGETPIWASAPAEYRLTLRSIQVVNGSQRIRNIFVSNASVGRLQAFEKPLPWSHDFKVRPEDAITIDATVSIDPPLATSPSGPYIDRFGQAIDADFPGKVKTDAELQASLESERTQLEEWKPDGRFDKYGGLAKAPWTEKATGFYHVAKHDGLWWLITPLGNPCFYTGMCTAPDAKWDASPETGREGIWAELPPKTGKFAPAWSTNPWGSDPGIDYVGFNTVNLIRKFGEGWERKTTDEMVERLKAWGFSGLGKWDSGTGGLPSVPVLNYSAPKIGRHPDVFDPTIMEKIRHSLASLIGERKNDPNIVGWSIGNEYDEIITPEEVVAALKLPDETPLKKALIADVLANKYGGDVDSMKKAWANGAPKDDLENMRRFYATAYYSSLYKTVKSIDPNHLYLGFWIVPEWWVNESDWSLIAPYCDVIGYDRYAQSFGGIENLFAKFDKPVLLGEFSYPAWYGGARGFGRYAVYTDTESESGAKYAELIGAASRSPVCVGALWFQYRDEPLTGRGPGKGSDLVIGEHYAFGFVDVADRPKTDLVTAARTANLKAAADRLAASHPAICNPAHWSGV